MRLILPALIMLIFSLSAVAEELEIDQNCNNECLSRAELPDVCKERCVKKPLTEAGASAELRDMAADGPNDTTTAPEHPTHLKTPSVPPSQSRGAVDFSLVDFECFKQCRNNNVEGNDNSLDECKKLCSKQ